MPRAEQCKTLASLIDSRILSAYHLFDTNYIAFDMQEGTSRFESEYTPAQKEAFIKHLELCKESFIQSQVDCEKAMSILLGIYANPTKAVMSTR